ncbi:hypothetical protein ACFLZW_02375 [Chloroflexota bacterium]
MKKHSLPSWSAPIALLLLCFASFGSMLSKLGFYWDDWTIVWYTHFLGPSSFQQAYAVDRPLLASIVTLTTSLLGESALNWQIFAIFARFLCGLSLWWTIRLLWPKKLFQATAIASLFLIYPGFLQGHIAITYGNGFIIYALFLLSFGLMIQALRHNRYFWLFFSGSIALSGYAMFTAEYFFGLELLRPFILWLALEQKQPQPGKRIKPVGLLWAPYILLITLFLLWRISTPTPRAQITILNELAATPVSTILGLLQTIAQDLFKATALAWKQTTDLSVILGYETITLVKYAGITLGAALLTFLTLIFLPRQPNTSSSGRFSWALQAALLGILAMLLGGIPIWVTDLRFELFFPWDRFTLPMMVGAALLVTGLIEALSKIRWQRAAILAVAVGLAAGMHFQTSLNYRQEWLSEKDFLWQLAWRAPGIEPGTTILTTELPFQYNWDNSLTAPLNWIYAPQIFSHKLPYLIYNVESRLSAGEAELETGTPIDEYLRLTPFHGSTDQAIFVFYRPPACLKVIDPLIDQRFPDKPRYFKETLPFSNPDLILTNPASPAQPPEHILGPEPAHDWCYYFEKADLARQQGDWQQVAQIGDLALTEGKKFYRKNVTELMPFIEGYAHVGKWEKAVQHSLEAHQIWENTQLMLCELWQRIAQRATVNDQGQLAIQKIQNQLQCQP